MLGFYGGLPLGKNFSNVNHFSIKFICIFLILDAVCVSLPDDKNDGLLVSRPDQESVLVPFKQNVTLECKNTGRYLRKTATSNFRQCVYDPKPVSKPSENLIFRFSYNFFISRVCLIIGYQDYHPHVREPTAVCLYPPRELNTAVTQIPNTNHHFSSDVKKLSNWQVKPAKTITSYVARLTEFGISVI